MHKRQKGLSTDNQQILGPGLKQYVGDGNRGKEGPKSHQRESRGNLKRVAGREQLSSWLNNHFLPIQEEAAAFLDITGRDWPLSTKPFSCQGVTGVCQTSATFQTDVTKTHAPHTVQRMLMGREADSAHSAVTPYFWFVWQGGGQDSPVGIWPHFF